MAKNTKQIALIQHRRGKLSELPTQLNEGEFGLAQDTNQLFIGNPTNKNLSKRIDENIFPYGNIEVLTEFTDNLQKIKYTYKSNTDIIARIPIIIYGNTLNPILPANTSIIINGHEIYFKNSSNLQTIVNTINSDTTLDTKAFIYNDSFLGLISSGLEIYIEDGIIASESNVKLLGISSDGFYSQTSEALIERTLQETLDDYCSIKAYDVKGDGKIDDSSNIFNAIVATYKIGNESQYYRTLFFPSGEYLINTKSIPLPTGTHLKGEGIGRTVIKSTNLTSSLLLSMDSNFNLSNELSFSNNSDYINYVEIEDMTLDISNSGISSLLSLGSSNHVLFKNVEFVGNDSSNLVNISNGTSLPKSFNIIFDNCIFNNGYNAIISASNIEHLVIRNCVFKNISREAILFNNSDNKIINSIIDGNIFTNCGTNSNLIISLADNCEFISVINNKFDETVSNGTSKIKPYQTVSSLNYTDILEPTTNTKKLLQFKFTQPVWEYIDYLMNPNGEYLIKPLYNTVFKNGVESIPSLKNGLVIQQGDETNDNTLTLKSSLPYGHLNISSGNFGSINIGKNDNSVYEYDISTVYKENDIVQVYSNSVYTVYECVLTNIGESLSDTKYWKKVGEYSPDITIHKNLNLNDNSIVNNGYNGNINFIVDENGILTIEDVNGIKAYNNKISSIQNAIPTVNYVNSASSSTIIYNFDYAKNATNGISNQFNITYFDPKQYGDIINLDRISINVRTPYYSIQDRIKDALVWKSGLRYYVGDVFKDPYWGKYWMATEDHIAKETDMNFIHWDECYTEKEILLNGTEESTSYKVPLNDVKYLTIIATNDVENPARLLFKKDEIDISKRDIKGQYYPNWVSNKAYKANDKVSFRGRYWQCLQNHTSNDGYDLYNINLWTAISEEGFNYIYEFDRDITPIDFQTGVEINNIKTDNDNSHGIEDSPEVGYIDGSIKSFNYSGYRFYAQFMDKDLNVLPIVVFDKDEEDPESENPKHMEISSAGYLTIKIKYVRGENDEA